MKDFFSAFTSDFLWPLATLLLPGVVALTPGGVALLWRVYPVREFVQSHDTETWIIVGIMATFCGLILEDFGARLELLMFDWVKEASWDDDWYMYLRADRGSYITAHKYIHSMLLRLKFELGCIAATPFAIAGLWFWPLGVWTRIFIAIAPVSLSSYLLFEAFNGVKALAEIRTRVFGEMTANSPLLR